VARNSIGPSISSSARPPATGGGSPAGTALQARPAGMIAPQPAAELTAQRLILMAQHEQLGIPGTDQSGPAPPAGRTGTPATGRPAATAPGDAPQPRYRSRSQTQLTAQTEFPSGTRFIGMPYGSLHAIYTRSPSVLHTCLLLCRQGRGRGGRRVGGGAMTLVRVIVAFGGPLGMFGGVMTASLGPRRRRGWMSSCQSLISASALLWLQRSR